MSDNLPPSILVAPGQRFQVVEKSLGGPLGATVFAEEKIYIEVNQPKAGKHHILLHELIHIAAEKLKQSGLLYRQPPEAWVTLAAGALFPMLASSGLWNGVSPRAAMRFAARAETKPVVQRRRREWICGGCKRVTKNLDGWWRTGRNARNPEGIGAWCPACVEAKRV